MNETLLLLGVWFILGSLYAVFISLSPFSFKFTWLSVFVGVAVTNLGISLAVFLAETLTMWGVIWTVWLFYGVTGGPMIAGQVAKDLFNLRSSYAVKRGIGENDDGAESEIFMADLDR
jgi:hypothetical protein